MKRDLTHSSLYTTKMWMKETIINNNKSIYDYDYLCSYLYIYNNIMSYLITYNKLL